MSAEIIPLHRPTENTPAEVAWQEYARLASAMNSNPVLMTDRAHVEATILAHDRFRRLFLGASE